MCRQSPRAVLGEGGAVTEGALGVMGEAGIGADGALKIGVVGVGVMGSNHARVLSEMSNVRLVGIADPDRKQRDFVARTLGCAAFGDLALQVGVERGVLEGDGDLGDE